uniref:DNA-directed RNA polymerase subunit beta n=1 Tax=Lygus hesperus TaxID=30085 RepID=A0A0A9Y8V4_LYGHE
MVRTSAVDRTDLPTLSDLLLDKNQQSTQGPPLNEMSYIRSLRRMYREVRLRDYGHGNRRLRSQKQKLSHVSTAFMNHSHKVLEKDKLSSKQHHPSNEDQRTLLERTFQFFSKFAGACCVAVVHVSRYSLYSGPHNYIAYTDSKRK